MMSEPRLYQSIAAEIVALIEKGEFPPGSRLPGERDLAERLGVVHHAHLLGDHRSESRHTGSTHPAGCRAVNRRDRASRRASSLMRSTTGRDTGQGCAASNRRGSAIAASRSAR